MQLLSLTALVYLALSAFAHPGELEEHGTPERREFLHHAQRSIANCREELVARGHVARAIQRRAAFAETLRVRGGLERRALEDVLALDHKSTKTGLTANSSSSDIFTGDLQCVLQAETTEGPYWVKGELVRNDIVEDEPGVPLYTEYQLIDVNTCQPLSDVYLESWHANSTGVYSGVVANGNGNSADASNINNTALRGVAKTDADGVVQFHSIFPGHYTGRATHIHIMANINATLLPNNTLSGGHVAHVGQAFFDQSLIEEVDDIAPYSTNTQAITTNAEDNILREEAESTDPVHQYVYLGSSVSDGLLAWLTIGVNASASYNVSEAVDWTASGGVTNPNGGGGPGGPGAPSGSGGLPPSSSGTSSGAAPTSSTSGAASSVNAFGMKFKRVRI